MNENEPENIQDLLRELIERHEQDTGQPPSWIVRSGQLSLCTKYGRLVHNRIVGEMAIFRQLAIRNHVKCSPHMTYRMSKALFWIPPARK